MAFKLKYTRYSANAQFVLGALCVIFGIADRATMYKNAFHTESVVAIWMGVWIALTGLIGIVGSRDYANTDRPSGSLMGSYLGFSVVSIIFAGVMTIMFSVGISQGILQERPCSQQRTYGEYYDRYYGRYIQTTASTERQCDTSVGLGSMVVIFAILEFWVGIWASICCCNGLDNCCESQGSKTQV
ncbi:hypothetical protein QZH41_016055, partial [Actinostola sp. cb2023]